jgi:hypothetical protein
MAKGPIIVLDNQGTVLEPTAQGKARKLLRNKQAAIHSREPFAIRLNKTVDDTPRNTHMSIINFTKYFEKERDVYIKNISGEQVSVTFDLGGNRSEGFLFPPTKDPLDLSRAIPFQAIKNSMDLRKMLNRRPPVLQLMSEEEFLGHYELAAKRLSLRTPAGKPDVDAAINAAEELRARLANKTMVLDDAPEPEPIHDVIEDDPLSGKRTVRSRSEMSEEELINPKILHLCHQVSPQITDKEKIPAQQLLDELKNLGDLKVDDYEYIRSHGWYKSVKNWAKQEIEMLVSQKSSDE